MESSLRENTGTMINEEKEKQLRNTLLFIAVRMATLATEQEHICTMHFMPRV